MVLAALAMQALLLAELPSYATAAHEQTVSGTIARIDARYHLRLRDDRGYFDTITLHPGTVITPRGLRLRPGMHVTIRGENDGSTFDADQIDAPAEYADEMDGDDYSVGVVPLFPSGYFYNGVYTAPPNSYYYAPCNCYRPYYPGYQYAQPIYVPVPVQVPVAAPPAQQQPPHPTFRRPLAEAPRVAAPAPAPVRVAAPVHAAVPSRGHL